MSIRIALVDDHEQFRKYLADVLSRQSGIDVVLQAEDGVFAAEALGELPQADQPDVLLMDLDMPRGGGIAATRNITLAHPQLRVIALTMHDDAGLVDAIRDAGACAYVSKADSLAVLIAAIRDSTIHRDPAR